MSTLRLVVVLAVCAHDAHSVSNGPSLADKLEGMILLGAYGDALGVPTECAGLQVTSPQNSHHLASPI